MTKRELADVALVLEGFDKGLFVRSTDGDSESGWAMKWLPYLGALARLQEAVNPKPDFCIAEDCDGEPLPGDEYCVTCRAVLEEP
jgi:hypothetical protein